MIVKAKTNEGVEGKKSIKTELRNMPTSSYMRTRSELQFNQMVKEKHSIITFIRHLDVETIDSIFGNIKELLSI